MNTTLMGWQLVPTGIGWRAFNKTLEEGRFSCENLQCKGRVDAMQPYRLRRSKNWFTVLFIPIIPLNVKGVYVECRSCKTVFQASALTPAPTSTSSPAPVANRPVADLVDSPVVSSAAPGVTRPVEVIAPQESVNRDVTRAASRPDQLVFDGGGSVNVCTVTIVGRDPSAVDAYPEAAVFRFDDPTMTMSKTHAAFGVDAAGVWVTDLGAANGVVISVQDQPDRVLRRERLTVPPGATVLLGEQALQIARPL